MQTNMILCWSTFEWFIWYVNFHLMDFLLRTRTRRILATITRGGVYALEKEKQAFYSTRQRRTTVEVWHPPHPRIVFFIKNNFLGVNSWNRSEICKSCKLGKSSKLPFERLNKRSEVLLPIMDLQLWTSIMLRGPLLMDFIFFVIHLWTATSSLMLIGWLSDYKAIYYILLFIPRL